MNRVSVLLPVCVLIAVFSFPGARAMATSDPAPISRETLVHGNSDFALHLFHELGRKKGNLCFSPYSVSSALGMTYAGARENTAREMAAVFHFPGIHTRLHGAFKDLNTHLTATAQKNSQKLNIANALILTGGEVNDNFKDILKDHYDAEIFGGGLSIINGWVNKKTEGKIKTILDELSPDTVCVLLNAVYFKGLWDSQFDKNRTSDAPFTVGPGQTVTVPLMYQKSRLILLEEKDIQVLVIPYKGNRLSMVILLPRAADGLTDLEKQLNTQTLGTWLEKLDQTPARKVGFYLPRFKLETSYNLIDPFKKMGMREAFEENKADFSGMGWEKGRLWIGQIKHKAFVNVNEEGTEAAAATAVEMVTKSVHTDPVFRADHPFVFIIRDNTSGSLMFMGRVADPRNG